MDDINIKNKIDNLQKIEFKNFVAKLQNVFTATLNLIILYKNISNSIFFKNNTKSGVLFLHIKLNNLI